jgi:RHS repeat-associated protein
LDSTGLYYYGARYYDANIGRFISADTIVPHPSDPQSLNRYSYCRNNPLRYTDPSGHGDGDNDDDDSDEFSPPDDYENYLSFVHNGGNLNYTDWKQSMERHTNLDFLGLGPWGLFCDLGNSYLYFKEGDIKNGFISLGFAVPGLGDIPEFIKGGKAFVKLADEGDDLYDTSKSSKFIPNPGGKLGGPLHRATIDDVKTYFEARGFKVDTEVYIPTPGGNKPNRYGDIVIRKGDSQIVIQVGVSTKGGDPIARERRALEDLMMNGWHVGFIPYK